MLFNLGIGHYMGDDKALEFFTGCDQSLSVDNVFVFALLFSYFSVPPLYQHKVLVGHPERGHAGCDDRGKRGPDHRIRLDHLRVRRILILTGIR